MRFMDVVIFFKGLVWMLGMVISECLDLRVIVCQVLCIFIIKGCQVEVDCVEVSCFVKNFLLIFFNLYGQFVVVGDILVFCWVVLEIIRIYFIIIDIQLVNSFLEKVSEKVFDFVSFDFIRLFVLDLVVVLVLCVDEVVISKLYFIIWFYLESKVYGVQKKVY